MKLAKKIDRAMRDLGQIDKNHESGKITKKQHDRLSKKALYKLTSRKLHGKK